jgi:RNA polymerase sigma-70 factor (sigma-E family)
VQASERTEYVDFVSSRLPALRRLAYGLCGDWHRADDLIQTTLTKVYLHWSSIRKVNDVDRYVRAIVVKAYLSELRLGWASRVRLVAETPDSAAPAGREIEDREVLNRALDQLPRKQRAVLVLRFVCDLGIPEVAEIMHCSPGTVKSQTFHGLASLRRRLDEVAYPVVPGRQS